MSKSTETLTWKRVILDQPAEDVRVLGQMYPARQTLHFAVCPSCHALVHDDIKGSLGEHEVVCAR